MAQREAEERRSLANRATTVVIVPYMASDIADMNGLLEMSDHLVGAVTTED